MQRQHGFNAAILRRLKNRRRQHILIVVRVKYLRTFFFYQLDDFAIDFVGTPQSERQGRLFPRAPPRYFRITSLKSRYVATV